MSSWGCPHEIDGICQRVRGAQCDPGMLGCVIQGQVETLGEPRGLAAAGPRAGGREKASRPRRSDGRNEVSRDMKTAIGSLLGVILAASTAVAQRSSTARETTPDALQQMLDRGEKVLVIDVRTDEEVKSGSIPGAIHIPMDQLEQRMKDVPRDVQLVFT